MTPPVRERRVLATPRLLAAALAVSLLPSPALLAQTKDWWDLHEDARKIIEDVKAGDSQIESARRSLLQAIRDKDTEGNLPTYNPSVRIDYLPYFYLGWASMRLRRYDDASKYLKKSNELGFISKGAPGDLKKRFDNFQQVAGQLKPAADALASAKANTYASQCVASAESSSGPKIKDAMGKLDATLSAPSSSDAGAIKGLMEALNGSVGDCVKEIGGRRIASLVKEYQSARDEVPTEGLADLLAPETQRDLDAALAGGKEAEAKGDEDGLKSAISRLKSLPAKIARDIDARLGAAAQEAEKLAHGNERALNEQNQLGTRLLDAAGKARGLRATGKGGKDLIAVARSAGDLKSLVATAKSTVAPLLQAKGSALDAARRDLESWSGSHACEVSAVGVKAAADAALRESAAARQGDSIDAMEIALAKATGIRPDVETKMKDILPRKQEEAKSVLTNADNVLANVPDPSKKSKGESLKQGVQQGMSKNDVCALDSAIASLGEWVRTVAPELDRQRKAAIARDQPALEEAQRLLNGFSGILKPDTVAALKSPTDKLAGLLNSSYDAAAMDATTRDLKGAAERADGEVRGQMQEGIRNLRALKASPGWSDVSPSRKQWLEQNLPSIEKGVQEVSNPDLLARFAKEYPRARLEMALASAFAELYDKGDAASAAKTLEDLGPGPRSGSAALNYALSYFYWWQGQAASSAGKEALMARAKEAYDAGKSLRVDLASLGAPLFAPSFVEEMSRR